MATLKTAFTLIELLVVVTIIVVLLAMLVPALDKALHQSELAVCASQLRAVGSGAIVYAHDHRRHYPHRPAVHDPEIHDYRVHHLAYSSRWGQRGANAPFGWDDRPTYKPYFPLKALQDPLSDQVDLETPSATDTSIWGSYAMWFGFRYVKDGRNEETGISDPALGRTPYGGMMRLGNRWTGPVVRLPSNEVKTERFNVLAGDLIATIWVTTQTSHPDSNGVLPLVTDDPSADTGSGRVTHSRYQAVTSAEIGFFDPAYVLDDGSVFRFPRDVLRTAARGTTWPANFQQDQRLSTVPSANNTSGRAVVLPKGS